MILTRAGEGWLRGLYWGIRAGGLTGRLATAGGAAPSGMMAVEQDSSIAEAATMAPPLNIFCIGPDVGPDFVPRTGKSASLLRSEEHTSELQSLMRISYAVFCL